MSVRPLLWDVFQVRPSQTILVPTGAKCDEPILSELRHRDGAQGTGNGTRAPPYLCGPSGELQRSCAGLFAG